MHPYIRCKGKRTCMVDVDVLSWASASSSASRATCKRCSRSRIRAAESSPPCCCRLSTARVSEWLYHTFIYTKNGVKDKGACRLHEWKVNNIDRLEWLRWYIYVRYTEPHTSVRLTARSRSHASWRAASASCRVNICDARRVISTCNAAFCSSNASSITEILASNYMSKELVLKAISVVGLRRRTRCTEYNIIMNSLFVRDRVGTHIQTWTDREREWESAHKRGGE